MDNRLGFVFAASLCVFASCGGKNQQDSAPAYEDKIDETLLPLVPDDDKVSFEEELYANADNSFFDFIYLFRTDSEFRKSRIGISSDSRLIKKGSSGNKEKSIVDDVLLNNTYYTRICNSEKDLDLDIEQVPDGVLLQELEYGDSIIVNYKFDKKDGKWLLTDVSRESLDYKDFMFFYSHFVNDSLFQYDHVADNLKFVTYDNDDEFSLIEADITKEQWIAFNPIQKTNVVSNLINYDDDSVEGKFKITSTVQIDTGYNVRCYFRKNWNRGWILYRYEDLSN